MGSVDSFKAKGTLEVGDQSYEIYRLAGVDGQETLPYSLKVLLENLLRTEDGANITADHIRAIGSWDENAEPFTNAVRITVSALRKRLGEPWVIATVAGVGYRIDTGG